MRMVVVFPAPFGPMKPNTSPLSSLRVSRSRAYRSPYFLVRVAGLDHESFPWKVAVRRSGRTEHCGHEVAENRGAHRNRPSSFLAQSPVSISP